MDGAFAHTCYRVLDPAASIKFYTECLGLEHVRAAPIRDEATNHFFAYAGDPEPWLELTHNHDRTEPYEIGTGYGHIAIKVDDLDATLAALDEKGVQPERAPYLVGTTRICFVRDPDGYRIELIERQVSGASRGCRPGQDGDTRTPGSHLRRGPAGCQCTRLGVRVPLSSGAVRRRRRSGRAARPAGTDRCRTPRPRPPAPACPPRSRARRRRRPRGRDR